VVGGGGGGGGGRTERVNWRVDRGSGCVEATNPTSSGRNRSSTTEIVNTHTIN